MLQIAAGTGDLAQTVESYSPSFTCTLRVEGDNTGLPVPPGMLVGNGHLVEVQWGVGGNFWIARLGATWGWINLPFPGHVFMDWIQELEYHRGGILFWSEHLSGSVSGPPDFLEADFACDFTDLLLGEQNTYTPVRGLTVQHFEEIACEGRWVIRSAVVAAHATFGAQSHTVVAGDAFASDTSSEGAIANLGYQWGGGNTGHWGRMNDLLLDG